VTIVGSVKRTRARGAVTTVPLAEDVEPVRQVAHDIDGDDGVEAPIGERKRAACVSPDETDSVGEAPFLGERGRGGNPLLE
jgi:hypothetical protein